MPERLTKEPYIIVLGWDSREKAAYEVCKHSIEKHTTSPHRIIPLYHKELRRQGYFQRPWEIESLTGNFRDLMDGRPFSTEFSHTRFLTPLLMKYKGWALFADCDMIFRCNIKEIFECTNDQFAVMCVKHRQKITKSEKMDGSPQLDYYRKNWSSFVLWNCGHHANKFLTKEIVNTATGGWLHSFGWLQDHEIGSLPDTYNWIAESSPGNIEPKVIHYTTGGPWFDNHRDVMFSEEWWKYYRSFNTDLPDPAVELSTVDYGSI